MTCAPMCGAWESPWWDPLQVPALQSPHFHRFRSQRRRQEKIDNSSSAVLLSSTSWPRGSFPTPSGTVFSISWRKWWKANLRSSATPRTGSSRPCSSTLLTYGKRHSCPVRAVAAPVGCSGRNCNWIQVRFFFFLANGTIVVSLFVLCPALQRTNQKGQSTGSSW